MAKISWIIAKIKSKIMHSEEILNEFYRREGITIGKNCLISSYIGTEQGFLISIGDNCTVASDVLLITHDYSIHNVVGKGTLFGRIKIGNNSFIGARSVILPGVSLADNIIVAAGSIVTHSYSEENIILGGNPAKIIGYWDKYKKKYEQFAVRYDGSKEDLKNKLSENPELLIKK